MVKTQQDIAGSQCNTQLCTALLTFCTCSSARGNRMVYRLTSMSRLFMTGVQSNWMTDVRLAHLCNSPLWTSQQWADAFTEAEKQYWVTVEWLWEKDVCVTWNQKSDIKQAIKTEQPTLRPLTVWLTACTMLSAGVPVTPRLLLSPSLHMTSRSASIMSGAECLLFEKKKKKKRSPLWPATYSVVIFKRQMEEHIMVRLKHVGQTSFDGLSQ